MGGLPSHTSFNPFATLVQTCKAIFSASPRLLNLNQEKLSKNQLFWSTPYKTDVMITSLKEILQLPTFSHMILGISHIFLELGHFDKHSPTTPERKTPQMTRTLPTDGQNQGIFSTNQVIFFQFLKKGREDLPLPPSSYASGITSPISIESRNKTLLVTSWTEIMTS